MHIRASHSIHVARPPDAVWTFTQDYARRAEWDAGIREARVLTADPLPRVAIRAPGGLSGVFQYKLFDAPRRTSVELTEVRSPFFDGGGGAWSYEARAGGTQWTVTNSLRFKSRIAHRLLGTIFQRALQRGTEKAMEAARKRLEGS